MLAARFPGRLARLTERATYTGYALPGIVVALALVFFGIRAAPGLYQTLFMLVFAYVVLFLPQAVGALRASLLQINPALEDAAHSLGAGRMSAVRRVVLPLVRPGRSGGNRKSPGHFRRPRAFPKRKSGYSEPGLFPGRGPRDRRRR